MIEVNELVDNAMDTLWDWCHEEKLSPVTNKRVFAMGLLHGEVLQLRSRLSALIMEGNDGISKEA